MTVTDTRRSPRWWRRTQVTARRMNLFLWLEVISGILLVVMLASSVLLAMTSYEGGKIRHDEVHGAAPASGGGERE